MPRGGVRPGSGRPKGAATKRTREIADRLSSEGILPLEVMLRTMRELWQQDRKPEACAVAEKAAPYIHPRLASIDAKVETAEVPWFERVK